MRYYHAAVSSGRLTQALGTSVRTFLKPHVSVPLIALAWLFVGYAVFARFATRTLSPPFESPHYFTLSPPLSAFVAFLWCGWLLLCAIPSWAAISFVRKLFLASAFLLSACLFALVLIRA